MDRERILVCSRSTGILAGFVRVFMNLGVAQ